MRKLLTLALGVTAALVPFASTSAATPEMGTFDNGYESFVDTEFCADAPFGFDVNATQHEYGTFQVFFDGDGNVARVLIHLNDALDLGQWQTLVERDTWTFIRTPRATVMLA
jgi:hypothetical protein